MVINVIDNILEYVPKVYHSHIFFSPYSKKWEWLPYSPNTHKDILSKVKQKDYCIKDSDLGKFIYNMKPIIREATGEEVDKYDFGFIKGEYGYFLYVVGYYKPIKLTDFNFKIK